MAGNLTEQLSKSGITMSETKIAELETIVT
jgi:hypothetical protein